MIRVVHVITDTNLGGAGRMLLTLLANRDRTKFATSVILPRGSVLEPEIKALGCKVVQAEGIADQSLSITAVFELVRLLCGLRPDMIHTHACMSARIAARLFLPRCKIVVTRHSVFDIPAYKKRFPYKTLSGLFNHSFSDRIIAVSPAAKENVVDIGVCPEKVAVVFNGVDAAKRLSKQERLEIRKRYDIAETDFVCAIIARLEKVKGHEYIIEAFKGLPFNIKLVIAGEGSEEKKLHAAARGHENIIFAGFVKSIHEIENIMDVQLNASYGTEATSAALLEGMSLGIPAIVSDFGGNPYVIENDVNGLIVPKRDAMAMRTAIVELKGDTERYNNMRKNGERIFSERFTSRAMTAATELEYILLMERKVT